MKPSVVDLFIIFFVASLGYCGPARETTRHNAEETRLSQTALRKLSKKTSESLTLEDVLKVSRETVTGTLTKLRLKISEGNTARFCNVEIMDEPWMKEMIIINQNCMKDNLAAGQMEAEQEDLLEMFNKFIEEYDKKYLNHEEYKMRFRLFQSCLEKIEELNKNELGTAEHGITQFCDMTEEEIENYMGLIPSDEEFDKMPLADTPDVQLPESFDWRTLNVVTPVKNQGGCGSCWVFAVVGNIEGQWALKTANLVSLSEQEIIDCNFPGYGCHGGCFPVAYDTVMDLGGLEEESDYPYCAQDGDDCQFDSDLIVARINGSVRLKKDEVAIAQWLYKNGPVAAVLNGHALLHYKGGILHPPQGSCNKGTHAILIVGFGVDKSSGNNTEIPYWIIKNSWGHKWGEEGYLRFYRGDNSCNIKGGGSSAVIL